MSTISAGTTSTTTLIASGDTTGSLVFKTNDTGSGGTTAMTIDTSQNVGIGTSSTGYKLDVQGTTPAYFGSDSTDGTRIGYAAALPTNTVNCFVGWIPDTVGTSGVNGDLALQPRTSAGANIRFFTGSTSASERARIDYSGNLLVGTTGVSYGEKFAVVASGASSNNAYFLYNSTDDRSSVIVRHIRATGSTGATMLDFLSASGSSVGTIRSNGTVTAYNTSSDYRLKYDIAPMTGALAKVAALKPCTYKWNADGSDGEGFIAHELAEVVPGCVSGEKDAVNEDGSIKPQGIDTSFLVATLTAAIQELKALNDAQASTITQLTERISALENK